jgi:hypothetical protein
LPQQDRLLYTADRATVHSGKSIFPQEILSTAEMITKNKMKYCCPQQERLLSTTKKVTVQSRRGYCSQRKRYGPQQKQLVPKPGKYTAGQESSTHFGETPHPYIVALVHFTRWSVMDVVKLHCTL